MIEYITPDRTANAIMQKSDSFSSFLVIEGEFDELFFNKFTNVDCNIEIGFGYEKVLKILEILNERKFTKALGIIDADFRILDAEVISIDNILITDFHDLEVSVINSDAFKNVLNFHIQKEKFEKNYSSFSDLRKHLFEIIKPLSYLKWLNIKNKLGIVFKPKESNGKTLDFSKFICINQLSFLDFGTLIKTVLDYSNSKVKVAIKAETLEKDLKDFITDVDLNHLCNGHDVIELMCLSLKKHISNLNSKAVSTETIHRELYLAYESSYFQDTKLYTDIKSWEDKNQLKILAF